MTVRMPAALLVTFLLALALSGSQSPHRQDRWTQYELEMQDPINDPPYAWETDSNRSERLFMLAWRRLTRLHVRSVEEIVDIDSDQMFNWPFLYAVGVGDWVLSDSQAARLRQYFERGGFLMVDDFQNEREWASFMAGIHKIFPNRQAIEIPDDAPIFQVAYDLRQRYHIPGYQIVRGQEWERGGIGGHYRGIVDDDGRVQVAICFNMDLGDAWEWADAPEYPEKYSALALPLGVNYVLYSMTH